MKDMFITFIRQKKNRENQSLKPVRKTDLQKRFSIGDATNWSYKMYENTEVVNDTVPSYRIDNLPERSNQVLLKRTNLTKKK